MANILAAQAGDHNAPATWIGGVVPGPGDTAYLNGFDIAIVASWTLDAISNVGENGATAGGTANLTVDGVTLTCDVYGGKAADYCVLANPSVGDEVTVIGDIYGGAGGYTEYALGVAGGGDTVIVGNGVSMKGRSVHYTGSGNCTHIGSIIGSDLDSNGYGMYGTGSGHYALIGTAYGGDFGRGLFRSSGSVHVQLAVGNDYGFGGPAIFPAHGAYSMSVAQASFTHGQCGSRGMMPFDGCWLLAPDDSTFQCRIADLTTRTLVDATDLSPTEYPAETDVRDGVTYASGNMEGSCAVPAAGSVGKGVPVDDTEGTAVLTAADVLDVVGVALEAFGAP